MARTFLGVDLAWKSDQNPSAVAVLEACEESAQLVCISEPLRSIAAVVRFVASYTTDQTVVAVDAPLIIKNQTSQRACETAIGRRYGKCDASCHTSNLTLYPEAASIHLTSELEKEGFQHAPLVENRQADRLLLEVYPHSALVELFGLSKIIKYKKGPVESKRKGQQQLRSRIEEFTTAEPRLVRNSRLEDLLKTDVDGLRGATLKCHEDTLDSLVCAYIAFYYWTWGSARAEIFGEAESGYIVNPSRPLTFSSPGLQ
jgi:predicted RNase H-like nuclease